MTTIDLAAELKKSENYLRDSHRKTKQTHNFSDIQYHANKLNAPLSNKSCVRNPRSGREHQISGLVSLH